MKNTMKLFRHADKLVRHSKILAVILLSVFLTSFQPPPSLVELFSFGHFHNAKGISVDPIGAIYVADTGDDLLMRFNPSGDSTGEVGGYGSGDYQFDMPYDVCADNGVEMCHKETAP